jgi:hypothetical protein
VVRGFIAFIAITEDLARWAEKSAGATASMFLSQALAGQCSKPTMIVKAHSRALASAALVVVKGTSPSKPPGKKRVLSKTT